MDNLRQLLLQHGLYASYPVRLSSEDREQFGFDENESGLLLAGNRGSSYWQDFTASGEYADGKPDPLDRWSKRVAGEICQTLPEYRALFPYDGPPFLPFQRWALSADSLSSSPLGLLIHPTYGLWHSFRFALLFDPRQVAMTAHSVVSEEVSPCASCATQPCLNTCPVDAFTDSGYDYLGCASYLKGNDQAICHQTGCEARNACPVAIEYQYEAAQHRFHLQAFLKAH